MGLGPGFWAAEHPPLCQQATSIQCVKYVTHIQTKAFAGTLGGDILKNVF